MSLVTQLDVSQLDVSQLDISQPDVSCQAAGCQSTGCQVIGSDTVYRNSRLSGNCADALWHRCNMWMTCSNADADADTVYVKESRREAGEDLEGGFWQASPQVGAS